MRRPSLVAAGLSAVILGGFVVEVVWLVGGTDLCAMAGAHATGVWLSGLAWFFATDGLLWNSAVSTNGRRQPLRCCCSRRPGVSVGGGGNEGLAEVRAGVVYYLALSLLQLGSTLCFGLVWRWDAFVWSAVLQSVLLVNAALAWQYAKFLAAAAAAADSGASGGRATTISIGYGDDGEAATSAKATALLESAGGGDGGAIDYANGDADGDADGGGDDDDGSRLTQVLKRRACGARCCACFRSAAAVVAAVLVVLLLNGAAFEAHGYAMYPPNGTFVTITHNRTPGGCTVTQRILTQCVTPSSSRVDAAEVPRKVLPTIWSEVGGGGHSMSDLWGLRDALVARGRRYCSYDPPGTGYSSPAVSGVGTTGGGGSGDDVTGYITDLVMDALGETGPFVLMGSMDESYDRAARFALEHPERSVAVVPVTVYRDEFQVYRDYHHQADAEVVSYARATLGGRQQLGLLVNVVPVSFGLMSAFAAPSTTYEPQALAAESLFLNLLNEKQWNTNIAAIRREIALTNDLDAFKNNGNYLLDHAAALGRAGVPVLLFALGRNASQLDDQCRAAHEDLDSDACEFTRFAYNDSVVYNKAIVAAANAAHGTPTGTNWSRVITCFAECADTDNAFTINQDGHIQWFADTLLQALAQFEDPAHHGQSSSGDGGGDLPNDSGASGSGASART